jgi:hypothetical protein
MISSKVSPIFTNPNPHHLFVDSSYSPIEKKEAKFCMVTSAPTMLFEAVIAEIEEPFAQDLEDMCFASRSASKSMCIFQLLTQALSNFPEAAHRHSVRHTGWAMSGALNINAWEL